MLSTQATNLLLRVLLLIRFIHSLPNGLALLCAHSSDCEMKFALGVNI